MKAFLEATWEERKEAIKELFKFHKSLVCDLLKEGQKTKGVNGK